MNRFAWMWNSFPFQVGEICCQKTDLNFVDSVWELFGPLLKGVPVVIVPHDVVNDPIGLIDTSAYHGVTRITLVPSLLRVMLEVKEDIHNRLPGLQVWVVSGEPLSIELCRSFQELLPGRILLNLYGSSEASADATCYYTDSLKSNQLRVPIGRPIANIQVYILDSNMQPTPIGVPGELHIGGIGLARGYLNRQELSAERFIPNPFGDDPGGELYKTGDLVRYLSDGNIEFLGRLDDQVKIRGLRVEPGEIESVLSQHPLIREANVIARADNCGD